MSYLSRCGTGVYSRLNLHQKLKKNSLLVDGVRQKNKRPPNSHPESGGLYLVCFCH